MDSLKGRIHSVDVLRGLVMVLMAIDHVRVYAAVPAGGTTPSLFLTRWVTNFCAPVFVFLAGTSIFLRSERVPRPALSRSILIRGAWLVVLELTFLRVAWTFNFRFSEYMLAGVIWMLGICMILMAALVWLPVKANAAIGLAIIVLHNLIAAGLPQKEMLASSLAGFWRILYLGGANTIGSGEEPNFLILYVIVPWIGVMAAGYAFGAILRLPPARRDRLCYIIGLAATALFVLLRYFNLYGDRPWASNPRVASWMPFLATTKYPASLLFLLMTLGPSIAVLPLFESARGRVAQWLSVYGRVPLFYYLLHIPLIHLSALLISLVRTPAATGWLFSDHPVNPGPAPQGYRWSLGLLYLDWAVVIFLLYFACRWFADLKARRKSAWMSYL